MNKTTLELLLEELELPSSTYKTAEARYEDLGSFLSSDSPIVQYEPQVFVQGSFCLGTAIKPLVQTDTYDLDLTCKLTSGISKSIITQESFKNMVGIAIDQYISKRHIKKAKESKRRCWRIEYQDSINFHMDVVPGIVIEDTLFLQESMIKSSISVETAAEWAKLAYNITDNKRPDYSIISYDWNISNPEGYAKWFEQRMEPIGYNLLMEKAGYKKLKVFERKTILQRCVQIFKRHRDIMFKSETGLKPISIIITTLAGQAFNRERTMEDAITNIIDKMGGLIKKSGVRIPNPTRPEEDFADKWKENPKLELAFHRWLMQAQADFSNVLSERRPQYIMSKALNSFGIRLDESMFETSIADKDIGFNLNRTEIDVCPPKPHMWK